MITGLGDFHSSQASDPRRISLYLTSRGWVPAPEPGGTLWVSHTGEFEVFVPKSPRMRGYETYIHNVLNTLATAEDRNLKQVVVEISRSDADVQYVRTRPSGDSGTTPIEDGVRSFESLHQWILANAVSASSDRHRLVQPSRKPAQALDFMRTVRLGPTLEGSYVMTVYIPVPPLLGQMALESAELPEAEQPFGRRVSRCLHDSTAQAVAAADEVISLGRGVESLTKRVGSGVNANLCEALAGLSGGTSEPVDIEFSWALSRPVEPTRPLVVTSNHSAVLREAAQELRAQTPVEDVRVVGAVVRLHREGSTGPGEVSIAGIVADDQNDRLRRVWFTLPEESYGIATQAHERGATVSVTGTLARRGTRHVLQNPGDFYVLPD
ncbi:MULTISPECIES: hypothetical protein [Kitasatospora]|uniref:Uncharacterized protein n=1 Tax=Kitasatospora setae (strain ATCC 33774 / DSM 43861 / JCM 3304 / KCC A-0304 / NBRC 14216 / KM-6054) TaxID=452652 RepID=E4NAD2_KITSK|nr:MULTISPECIES: hypothetical protein [Kitasatospora]BAJ28163.1 hypothetical protein KSE_23440 [Kitasatospora setae KM-6054]